MSSKSGKVEAFKLFGVKLKNIRWSSSGRAKDGTVVLSLWTDYLKSGPTPTHYDLFGDPRLPKWQNKIGVRERTENLKWARQHNDGIFRVVLATPADLKSEPRRTTNVLPSELAMRLIDLNEQTGEFSAQIVEGTGA